MRYGTDPDGIKYMYHRFASLEAVCMYAGHGPIGFLINTDVPELVICHLHHQIISAVSFDNNLRKFVACWPCLERYSWSHP